uniref:DEP domain-containing protein n=1 Tax=Globisporangium ultimum (strain ATCC 200006 / CBS 805.95 / DAOM BR144) TaxID=431595 RepID=K3WM51_GLOUD
MEPFLYFLLIGDAAMFGLCSVVVVYLRYKRHEAFQGDASAARKLILPAFEPLLWVMAILSGLTFWFLVIVLAGHIPFTSVPQWVSYFFDSSGHFVLLITPVLMLQKSISFPALRRAAGITLLLSTYLIPVVWVSRKLKADSTLTPGTQDVVNYIGLVLRLALLPIYVYVIVSPPARASKRTLREYCIYVGIYHGLRLVGNYLAEDRIRHKGQYELIYVTTVWGMFTPFVVWRVLKADTEHWRGLGKSACALQRSKSMSGTNASESSLNTRVAPQQQRMQTTGRHAVATMLREQIVQSRSEAIRLGNLLMDAGVLHHVKHGRPFEDDKAASQVYYFDHNCIQMYEPPTISILEEASTPEQQEALASSTGMKRITHGLLHQDASALRRGRQTSGVRAEANSMALLSDCDTRPCRCRALSQRLQQPKVPVYHKVLRKLKGHGPGTVTNMTTTPLLGAHSHSLTTNLLFANDYDTRYDGQDGGSFTVHVQQD